MVKSILTALAVWIAATSTGFAQDKLKVAIPQRGFWDSSWVEFGQHAGFFKDAGLDVEIFWTDGGAQTLTAALSGSVDVALSNGTLGVVGAYAKGAPVRVISAQMTGAGELYWYVRAESGIKSLKDAAGKTVAFSSPGSSSNLILLALLRQAQVDAKPLAAGGAPATLTQVMTGQIDVGWAAAPFGLQNILDRKITVIARTTDVPQLANQTIRVNIANTESLKTKRAAIEKFMRVYARAIDWAYQNPRAVEIFAQNMKLALPIARKAVDEFYPKAGLQIGEIKGLDLTLKDALDYKYIPAPKTAQEIAGLFDILYKPEK